MASSNLSMSLANGTQSALPDTHRAVAREIDAVKRLLNAGKLDRADKTAKRAMDQFGITADFLLLRATIAWQQGNFQSAVKFARQAQKLDPKSEAAVLILSECLDASHEDAEGLVVLADYLQHTHNWKVRSTLAQKLMGLRKYVSALEVLQSGLNEGAPNGPILENIGICLQMLHRFGDAAKAFELGMKVDPGHTRNFLHRALLAITKENADPRVYYLEALQANPGHKYAIVKFLWASLARCDWDAFDRLIAQYPNMAELGEGDLVASQWSFLPLMDQPDISLKLQRRSQERRLAQIGLSKPKKAARPKPSETGRIRVGYFSNDFYDHATLRLFSGVLRNHDHERFEIHCMNFGHSDNLSQENICHFDHIHSIQTLSNQEVIDLSKSIGLDIAVDLKGETEGDRCELFLLGQAPVQINYLGYPCTMGIEAYDYIIGDSVVIPPGSEEFYAEKIIRLPTCYLPSDDRRRAQMPPTRTELGLPEDAVVLACLNNPYKISREVFSIWLAALDAVPESVLWLWDGNPDSNAALRRAAKDAGIDEARLIFAGKLGHIEHITRLAQADLYLDTFHCNAHTLAAEAVCSAGVPLLTKAGQQFAARVGASFTTAAGLADLVCNSSENYKSKLIELARDPEELLRLRGVIASNRSTAPLFSSQKYTRLLEQAFCTAHDRVLRGLPAKSFHVEQDVTAQPYPGGTP